MNSCYFCNPLGGNDSICINCFNYLKNLKCGCCSKMTPLKDKKFVIYCNECDTKIKEKKKKIKKKRKKK